MEFGLPNVDKIKDMQPFTDHAKDAFNPQKESAGTIEHTCKKIPKRKSSGGYCCGAMSIAVAPPGNGF